MHTVRKFKLLLALCDENFHHFPLVDETLRHTELCKSVISHIKAHSEIRHDCFNSVQVA